MERVLDDGRWAYENATLVCKQVIDGKLPEDVVLDTVDMWLQVHGLLTGHTSDKILEQIGNYLGTFVKCDDRFVIVPWKAFYRIRVAIPVDKPIKRRMNFVKRDKSTCWVSFKYERLHNFCFYCGLLGHLYKFCIHARNATLSVEQYPFSVDLRAGLRRGPRAVGEGWLVPAEGKGVEVSGGVREISREVLEPGREIEGTVAAVAKRQREGDGGVLRREGSDVMVTDLSKNLFTAGAGSQSRPSS
ncbi:PREDICTED: uncharacterized protein LOC109178463 [Ipomoea nil]|uniref:uncharacterized protein LOC109178463 n=1 Tax=Ipomoea nil TaxID=35883 RepID=UPI000901B506|nr:PREDICTED: uncharacterized protein LOC109178463 [Ipomoea nil]